MHSLLQPYIPVAIQTGAVYLFLMIALRVLGRRQIGQLNGIDVIVILLLGSAVETAMIAGNTSLPAGLVSAATLLLLDRSIHFALLRSKRWRRLVTGGPILLVHDGHILDSHLRRTGLCADDVLEAVRERGEADLSTVRFAVLETNGEITVVPMHAPVRRGHRRMERAKDRT